MLEVMQAGNRRIVVLTETHVALMRVRVAAVRSVYRAMWKVRLTKIQTVRGTSPPRVACHTSCLVLVLSCGVAHTSGCCTGVCCRKAALSAWT